MPHKSKFPLLDIPRCNILSYLYPTNRPISTKPQWIDAADPSNSLSPAQMLSWIKRLAVGLDQLGVKKDAVVMVFTPNHIFVPMVYLGAAGSGRAFSGANPAYTANEVAYQMGILEAAVVFIHPALLETGVDAARQAGIPKDRLFQFDDSICETVDGVRDWRSIVATEEESDTWQWDDLGDKAPTTIAAINFSSGTTGLPKGVCITHYSLIANAEQSIYVRFVDTRYSGDKTHVATWLATLPLYHAYSQLWTISIALKLGVTVYVMRAFVFGDYLKYIQDYRVTELQTAPPIVVMLAKRPETKDYDLSSLKVIFCGAAPLKSELQNEVSKRFNLTIIQGWGMTELTCCGIAVPGESYDDTATVGNLIPNSEAMLVDDEGREVMEDDKPGEIWIRGPQVMLSYWRNEEATRKTKTQDGWLKTGDVAVIKGDKFWIVDRLKELIKVNGLQVAPAELEAVLLEHDDVADAAVTRINIRGEEFPRAYIVLQESKKGMVSEEAIQKWTEGRVAKHKRLVGGVSFVDAVPKLASGKIMRRVMNEWSKRDEKEIEGKVQPRL